MFAASGVVSSGTLDVTELPPLACKEMESHNRFHIRNITLWQFEKKQHTGIFKAKPSSALEGIALGTETMRST